MLHEYVLAPEAVKVVDAPWQSDVEEADTETVGLGLTVTVAEAEFVPPAVVPVTVYVVVLVGLTVILEPVEPLLQLYVLAPLAVNVAD